MQPDLLAPEDVDFFAEFIESVLTLNDSVLQLLLGAFSTAGDPRVAELQDRLDVLWPREHRAVQLQILGYNERSIANRRNTQ